MPRHSDTIAAPATPAGTSALAVLRISGADTKAIARALLGREPEPRVAVHGDYHDLAGKLVDDVVMTFFAGPRSYTAEDSLEITCHGNPYIVQRVFADLLARGCRAAEPGEFTQRAFLNGRIDLSQAEAVVDVIHARSERALAVAHRQLRGGLAGHVNASIDRLLLLLARVEAYIDFPEEDLPQEDIRVLVSGVEELAGELGRLMATARYGELLRDGIKTVIVGAPNVGKSSLLNRLVGRERALVSPEPGTTRDFIEERLMVGAHCLRIIDTAGLNDSPAPLEKLGIEKTWERLREADLFVLVLDGSAAVHPLPPELWSVVRPEACLVVLNKSDLGSRFDRASLPSPVSVFAVSAKTGAGLDELIAAIGRMADGLGSDLGPEGVAINARHAHALETARGALRSAATKLAEAAPVELLASDLRAVLEALGQITGKVDNERMLDQLFATFCIGK